MTWKGREKFRKFQYLSNEKSFLDEIKNIFHIFWRVILSFNKKNKKFIKNNIHKLYINCVVQIFFISSKLLSFPSHLLYMLAFQCQSCDLRRCKSYFKYIKCLNPCHSTRVLSSLMLKFLLFVRWYLWNVSSCALL